MTAPDPDPRPAFPIRVTGTVQLGHILQMLTLVGVVLSGGYTLYSTIQGQIQQQRADTELLRQIVERQGKEIEHVRAEQKETNDAIRTTLDKTLERLNELRVLIAGIPDGRTRR